MGAIPDRAARQDVRSGKSLKDFEQGFNLLGPLIQPAVQPGPDERGLHLPLARSLRRAGFCIGDGAQTADRRGREVNSCGQPAADPALTPPLETAICIKLVRNAPL